MFLIRFGVIALVVLMFLPGDPRTIGPDGAVVPEDAPFCERYPNTCAASGEILAALKHKLAFAIGWARERIGSQTAALQAPVEGRSRDTIGPPYERDGALDSGRRWDGSRASDWSGADRFARDTLRPEDREPDWRGRP